MIKDCILVGCVPPACCPYLPACTVPGGGGYLPLVRGGVCSQGGYLRLWSGGGGVCSQGGGTCLWAGWCIPACNGADPPPPCEQNSWHTFLKILPCPNFVAGGNKYLNKKIISFQASKNYHGKKWILSREDSRTKLQIVTLISATTTTKKSFLQNAVHVPDCAQTRTTITYSERTVNNKTSFYTKVITR